MPPPKKLERVNKEVLELLAVAVKKGRLEIFFPQEQRGRFTAMTMQVRNAIALFKTTKAEDIPPELKGLHPDVPYLGCSMSAREGKFEIGPASEVGMGGLITSFLRANNLEVDPSMLMSEKQKKQALAFRLEDVPAYKADPDAPEPIDFFKKPEVGTTQPQEQRFGEEGLSQCLPPDPRTLVD